MIGNIKRKFPPKTSMREKQVLQDPGYVDTVDTNKIPYSIHNNIALIFCVDHLDMPFNVHTTDKVTMMTISGFLTI